MDYGLLNRIVENDRRTKTELFNEMGISATGFSKILANRSIKVDFLERFCIVTKTHSCR
jgi:DNA-binding Xre family transcriptional regulator